jgi:hypothetical protein
MQTLHEYMMATKSVEYLLAVGFLAAFVLFWRAVAEKRESSADKSWRNDG